MKAFAKKFYRSRSWQECRKGYLASIFGKCERCEMPAKIVHHKILLTPDNINDPNVSLNWDYLEALCWKCHNKEHDPLPTNSEAYIRKDLKFTADGDVVKEYI